MWQCDGVSLQRKWYKIFSRSIESWKWNLHRVQWIKTRFFLFTFHWRRSLFRREKLNIIFISLSVIINLTRPQNENDKLYTHSLNNSEIQHDFSHEFIHYILLNAEQQCDAISLAQASLVRAFWFNHGHILSSTFSSICILLIYKIILHLVGCSVCKGCNGIEKSPILLKRKHFLNILLLLCRTLATLSFCPFFFVQDAVQKFSHFRCCQFKLTFFCTDNV